MAGFSVAAYHVAAPVLIKNVSGDKVGTGMSYFMIAGEMARSTGPLIIVPAVEYWGLDGAYRLILPGLTFSIILYFLVQGNDYSKKKNGAVNFSGLKRSWDNLKKLMFAIAGIVVSKIALTTALTAYLPLYLEAKGASIWFAGISLSVLEFSGAAGVFLAGYLSDTMGKRKILLASSVISPLIMFAFLLVDGFMIFPILILLGIISFAPTPIMMALIFEKEKEYPASANSIFMTINFLASSVVVLLIGQLSDIMDIGTTYWICAAFSLTGIFFTLKIPKS
jgi:FSR family fosmidomycin resistance protein-like MFS transporter